jgi:hypothetical protein
MGRSPTAPHPHYLASALANCEIRLIRQIQIQGNESPNFDTILKVVAALGLEMNKEILDNLYELWTYIGKKAGRLVENDNFKSVSMVDSDWPNRVFSIATGKDILSDLIDLIQGKECLGCGIVFFDSNNNAGLHMIGTIPNGRAKGIGSKMAESLLCEAKANESNYCVLHASKMGENIYKNLGFVPFGELETYLILEK